MCIIPFFVKSPIKSELFGNLPLYLVCLTAHQGLFLCPKSENRFFLYSLSALIPRRGCNPENGWLQTEF